MSHVREISGKVPIYLAWCVDSRANVTFIFVAPPRPQAPRAVPTTHQTQQNENVQRNNF